MWLSIIEAVVIAGLLMVVTVKVCDVLGGLVFKHKQKRGGDGNGKSKK